jgi:hypothetical protein
MEDHLLKEIYLMSSSLYLKRLIFIFEVGMPYAQNVDLIGSLSYICLKIVNYIPKIQSNAKDANL